MKEGLIGLGIVGVILSLLFFTINSVQDSLNEIKMAERTVASSVDAGQVENILLDVGGFNTSTVTTITTTEGVYMVYGHFSYIKGDSVVLETRESGRKYICVKDMDKCNRMAR